MENEGAKISSFGLNVRTEREGEIAVVQCGGRLTAENAAVLKDHVKRMIPHEKRILMDLAELTRMDSVGLGALVGIYISSKNANCDLRLVNLSKPIRELLGLTQLLSVFEACGRSGTRLP